eukprot:symbB.v1.2.023914.t1/scaffold2223.1/size85388/4
MMQSHLAIQGLAFRLEKVAGCTREEATGILPKEVRIAACVNPVVWVPGLVPGDEAVIISCGAPDSFEVYEVCFESLTKIGFTLPCLASKELLLKLLEDVHEAGTNFETPRFK